MINDILKHARAVSFKNLIVGVVSAPFLLIGYTVGRCVAFVKLVIAALITGYERGVII
jgi:hypothetical protein